MVVVVVVVMVVVVVGGHHLCSNRILGHYMGIPLSCLLYSFLLTLCSRVPCRLPSSCTTWSDRSSHATSNCWSIIFTSCCTPKILKLKYSSFFAVTTRDIMHKHVCLYTHMSDMSLHARAHTHTSAYSLHPLHLNALQMPIVVMFIREQC